jgi:carbamoylphosphate synthase large subunit
MTTDLALLGVASVTLVGLAVVSLSRRVTARRLMRLISFGSTTSRTDAVVKLAQQGLDMNARVLLNRVRTERDPEVLDALARAVSMRQWEPETTTAISGLRAWAGERLSVRRAPEAGAGQPRTRILVTGAGGPAGIAVIEGLRAGGHWVAAADCDDSATGMGLADAAVTLPRATANNFVAEVLSAAIAHRAEVVISTVAEELAILSRHAEVFTGNRVQVLFPSAEAVEACCDKLAFAQALHDAGVPHPITSDRLSAAPPGPWIVKPRAGRGSRGVHAPDTYEELAAILVNGDDDVIVQTRSGGREWTADCYVNAAGVMLGASPRWRSETKAGISVKGITFRNEAVEQACAAACAAVGLTGPACVQGFLDDDGTVEIIEINPRFSGGLPLTLAAGCDTVGEYLREIRGGKPNPANLVATAGVRMRRYFAAVYDHPAWIAADTDPDSIPAPRPGNYEARHTTEKKAA